MSFVHIANTHVEFEFAQSTVMSLEQSLSRHSTCLQLQFLPLLYAEPKDVVAVTHLPSADDLSFLQQNFYKDCSLPRLALLKETDIFRHKEVYSWGPSCQVQQWAKDREMTYHLPQSWEMICLVNSKAFSYRYSSLKEASLIYHQDELKEWLIKVSGAKLLKTCFGFAGQGNKIIHSNEITEEILLFCQKEWQHKRAVIGEPLLDRLNDFSTQWLIHPHQQIEYLGATRFETDEKGTYQGTLAGSEENLFSTCQHFLNEHKVVARRALEDMASMGFFGHVGIDALLYRHPVDQSICLYPLVEINARQTMSLVALKMQKKICPKQVLRFTFEQNKAIQHSLLPSSLVNFKEKTVFFSRRLMISPLPLNFKL